ncbi:HEAT repeat domain-containing protein [Candidatus Parabeggiatoa sp. HSG14]|uniref:HEAT repeat domain-containing protein n=1 Tax=Candidatus Parabeggiatoa sp. HSG14 TaxID=3055593 RepID=UPI0025A76D08|nr:HEAT repeat domain-containing protein [Thiotrichales bacterium HSG14]
MISTLGSAIVTALQPVLESAAGAFLGNRFSEQNGIRAEQRKAAEQAINDAFEEWIIAILNNLKAQEYEEKDLRQFFTDYKDAVEKFLNDSEVIKELLKPFFATTTKYKINDKLLTRRWTALKLRSLPEEFEITSVSRAYLHRVKNAGIVTSELRELFRSQMERERTDYLEAIRGVWPDFDLDNYAERVKIRYRVLDLSALTPPSRDDVDDGRILLKDVFVPQMVRESRPPRELPREILDRLHDKGELNRDELPEEFHAAEFKRLQESWTQAQPESVLTAVAKPENNRLILLGDPGSGKSTLARYLLLSVLAETTEVFKTEVFAGHLPLLIELRNYMGEVLGNNCAGFLEYFHHLGKTQGYTLNHLELKEQLKTRPSLIIFDGLDEIFDPNEREKITQEIIGFALEYQDKARVLVTSRIIGYQGKALQAADFCEYTLQDLEPEQIKTFARGWFDLVFRDKPEEAASRYQRIETALQHSPAIKQLAGNPLLLTMIAIIAKHQELPRERAQLYAHATKVLCHHWDVTGHKISVKETPADFMREDDKLELLRKIAWRMQASEKGLAGNFILSDDLHDEIAHYLRNRWGSTEVEIGQIRYAMVNQLRERNFILCLYGAQLYGFVHRTFLEYFCAAEIVYQFEKQQTLSLEQLKTDIFLAHFRDETWHEVLRLICGMIEPHFTGELVEFLVSHAKIEVKDDFFKKWESNPLKELVFTQTCFNETGKQIKSTAKLLHSKFQDFVAHDDWSVRIAAFDSLAEHYKDNPETYSLLVQLVKDNKDIQVPRAAVDSLAKHYKDNSKTYSLLVRFVKDNKDEEIRSAAVKSLAKHYKDNRETYSLLQQVVKDDKNEYVRRAVVYSLTEHYKDNPETYSLLVQVVKNDKHEHIRRVAVKSLAEHYKDNSETYSLLVQFVKDDKHEDVRIAAVDSLAEHYKDNPETYFLLVQVVKDNKDEDIRSTTVSSLAQHYKDNRETYSLLQQFFKDDKHEDVRRAAVKSLAEHYKDNPETYSLLQQVVKDDKDWKVRRAAVYSLAEHYKDNPEILLMLQQIIINDEEASSVRSSAVGELAKISYDDTWQRLLSKYFLGSIFGIDVGWIDSKALIDEERVKEAAKRLKLPPETIRKHYEDIAKEIPLQLSWK